MNRTRVTPGEYVATMAALARVMEELEETQEIARVAFEEPDLEATQEIPNNIAMTGSWKILREPTPTGEVVMFERAAK